MAVLVLAAVMFAGCGDDSDGPLADLGPAACADLDNGMSFFQVAQGGMDSGLSRKQVAAALVLATEDHCPEWRDELQATDIPSWLD